MVFLTDGPHDKSEQGSMTEESFHGNGGDRCLETQ